MSRHDIDVVQVRAAVRLTDSNAFGTDTVAAVAREIGSLGIPGQAIDGADLGLPGWIIARMIGDADSETILGFNAERKEPSFDVSWTHLRAHLQSVFGVDVQVSDEITVDGHVIVQDGLFALGPDHVAVLATRTGDHLYEAFAAGLGNPLRRLTRGDYDLIEGVEPPSDEDLVHDLTGDMSVVSSGLGRQRVIVLWRRGSLSGVELLRKGELITGKIWEPAWRTIQPIGADRDEDLRVLAEQVADDLVIADPEVSEFVSQFDLDPEAAVHLRAMFRRPAADFGELCTILGLPAEAGQILEGDPAMETRPGFDVIEPKPVGQLIREEFNRMPEGKGIFARIQRGAVRGAWWYIAANMVFVVVCALIVFDAFRGGASVWMGVLAGLLGTFTVVEQFVRVIARAKTRRDALS